MDQKWFLERRIDDFTVVDGTLRDMMEISDDEMNKSITKVIRYLNNLFEMPHNEYDEKVLNGIRKRMRK